MLDLKACAVCLSTDVKLHSMKQQELRVYYNLISGLQTTVGSGLPDYLCYQCTAFVKRFKLFREKCQKTHYLLHEILQNAGQIKKSHLHRLDRQCLNIAPQISYLDTNQHQYKEIKYTLNKFNRDGVKYPKIPTVQFSTFDIVLEIDTKEIKTDVDGTAEAEVVGAAEASFVDNDVSASDNDIDMEISDEKIAVHDDLDGSLTDPRLNEIGEEYAQLVPISTMEAKAAMEVYKMTRSGSHRCDMCGRAYVSENRLKKHLRMHDMHFSGNYRCELCNFYYKTQFLLTTHMTEKHTYKYLCQKCPEVSFDRTTAKQHYIWAHLQKGTMKTDDWYESRPAWLNSKGGKRCRVKGQKKPPGPPAKVKKLSKIPPDYLTVTIIPQETQYSIVMERQNSRNYKESKYKCQYCFKGYRLLSTFNSHMKKHDPELSGPLQCDMCKMHFKNQRLIYKHMIITHVFKYSCQMCSYVCFNRAQATSHYKWHNNVTYQCPHCDQEFAKLSTRLTHIRIKHPSMHICNICGHSFVSLSGLYCHKRLSHTEQEIAASESIEVDTKSPSYCADCNIQFMSVGAFDTHLGSSYKHAATNLSIKTAVSAARRTEYREGRPRGRPAKSRRARVTATDIVNTGTTTATNCEVCGELLANDVQAKKHYESEHPGTDYLKRYMCDVCGHTTKQYANLLVHMRTHTNEKPYNCPLCGRRFSMPSNRDRHMVVHTGEKRYQCQHCNRRFTQSSAVKLHIQTVHLKIPYAPWDKKNRKRRKELEGAGNFAAVEQAPEFDEQAHRKILFEPQGDYLNAYINYNDE